MASFRAAGSAKKVNRDSPGFGRPLYPPTALRSIGRLIYMFLAGGDIDLVFSLRLD